VCCGADGGDSSLDVLEVVAGEGVVDDQVDEGHSPGGQVLAQLGRAAGRDEVGGVGAGQDRDARGRRCRVLVRTIADGLGSRLASTVPSTRPWLATDAREVERLDLMVPAGTMLAHDGETLEARGSVSRGVRVLLELRPAALRVYAPAEESAAARGG
jgi:hypothetical protein